MLWQVLISKDEQDCNGYGISFQKNRITAMIGHNEHKLVSKEIADLSNCLGEQKNQGLVAVAGQINWKSDQKPWYRIRRRSAHVTQKRNEARNMRRRLQSDRESQVFRIGIMSCQDLPEKFDQADRAWEKHIADMFPFV